jgi:CheY-like chemotaxis protein
MSEGGVNELPPRVRRTYLALSEDIESGALAPGAKLPSNTQLAAKFGVSAVTMLRTLNELQKAGVVSVEHGRGTFVTGRGQPAVLIVDDQEVDRLVLRGHVERFGYRILEAASASQGQELLAQDASIRLVFSDVRMPRPEDGIAFIAAVRRAHASVGMIAVTAHPGDLEGLHGAPECPILVIAKPVRSQHVEEALRLVMHR